MREGGVGGQGSCCRRACCSFCLYVLYFFITARIRSDSSFSRITRKFCSSGMENACHCRGKRGGGRGENRKLALRDTRPALCFLPSLTSTSPVSLSLRTKLSRCRSGPAFNLRRRGRSCRGSFWNRSAGAVTTANEMTMENKAVFSPNEASLPHLAHRGASACTMRTCRDCPKP